MKFHKVLKKLYKDPKRKFSSKSASMMEQDLDSIKFWLTDAYTETGDDDDSGRAALDRSNYFDKMFNANDWEEVTNET